MPSPIDDRCYIALAFVALVPISALVELKKSPVLKRHVSQLCRAALWRIGVYVV